MIMNFPWKKGSIKKLLGNWIFLSLISAILLIISFETKAGTVIGWVSFVPLFIIILNFDLKRVIFSGLITGIIFNSVYLLWLKEYNHPLTLPLSIFTELLYFLPSVILVFFINKYFPDVLKPVSFSAIWVFIDYLKSVGFLAFPWGIIGYTQYPNIPLIQIASIFGVWGIDYLLIYFNFVLSLLLLEKRKEKRIVYYHLYILLFLIFISHLYGFFITKKGNYIGDKSIRLSLIQANFNPWNPNVNKNLKLEMDLTRRTLIRNPEMIIWSESSVPFPYDYFLKKGSYYAVKIDRFIKSLNRGFLFGGLGFEGNVKKGRYIGKFYNVGYFYDPDSGYQFYRKIHLVPFGEYFPYKRLFPFVAKILESAGAGDFTPGNKYVVFDYRGLKFSVLICFEDVFGDLARQFVKKGSRLLVNITNDAWSGSKSAEIQHFVISILRSVENRVSLVRVANGGVTGWIDPYGRIKETLPLFKKGFLVCDVPYSNNVKRLTFYTRYGDFLPKMLMAYLIIFSIYLVIRKILDIILKRNNINI